MNDKAYVATIVAKASVDTTVAGAAESGGFK